MPPEKKNFEKLAEEFARQWRKGQVPQMSANDLLDLMDYFSRLGMEFESELCRYFAELREPDNFEVLLTKAHVCADEGDWNMVNTIITTANLTGYDKQLFSVERLVRSGELDKAMHYILSSTPRRFELPDYDFLYDCSMLLRDYGYMDAAVRLLGMITPDYVDFAQVQELTAECYALAGDNGKAKRILNTLLDRDSFNLNFWVRLAHCCYKNKDYEEGREACEYAIAISENLEALRIRNYIKLIISSDEACAELFDMTSLWHDYRLDMEFGDILYRRGLYALAERAYREASIYCPRGGQERIRILTGLILTLMQEGKVNEAFAHLKAVDAAYVNEVWEVCLDAAQIALEGNMELAMDILQYAVSHSRMTSPRYASLASLLNHYQCGEEAAVLWQLLKDNRQQLPQSYLRYLPD